MAEDLSGTSRRDVLRGSAIGMGALVGGMVLTASTDAEAQALPPARVKKFNVSFSNFSPKNLALSSASFGGDNANGTPAPEVVTLTMPGGVQSPHLLKAFAQETTGLTVTIEGIATNANGTEYVDLVVTFTGAEIVHYHVGLSGSGMTDSVHIGFGSVDVKWADTNFHYTWAPPA